MRELGARLAMASRVLRAGVVVVAVTLAVAAPAPVAADPLPPLTHTTPLTPTGEVVPAGHVERVQALTAFYHQLALGLGDGFELRAAFPGLPIPILGADLELRWAPLSAGRFALVVGAGGTAEWIDGADLWVGGAATLAWREPGWSLHTTLRAASHVGDDDHLSLATVGGTVRVGRGAILFAEVGEVAWRAPVTCAAHPKARGVVRDGCVERHAGQGVWLGVWWTGRDMRYGVSALIVRAADLTLPILPLLSFAWDYDL